MRAAAVGGKAGTPASLTVKPSSLKPNTAVPYGTAPDFTATDAYPACAYGLPPIVPACPTPPELKAKSMDIFGLLTLLMHSLELSVIKRLPEESTAIQAGLLNGTGSF
jgi:hypothetical protein